MYILKLKRYFYLPLCHYGMLLQELPLMSWAAWEDSWFFDPTGKNKKSMLISFSTHEIFYFIP